MKRCYPVGVPKLPYRLPGEEDETWVDMYNILYRERLLFVLQEIQEELAGQVCGVVQLGDMEDVENREQEPVPYNAFVCSTGGSLYSGYGIYDALKFAVAPVFSWCLGLAASTATLAILGGHAGNRFASPNARLMVHQPASSRYDGPIESCIVEGNELLRLRQSITQIYQSYMGLEVWQIHMMLNHDFYLNPETARKYNLIDDIFQILPDEFWVSVPPTVLSSHNHLDPELNFSPNSIPFQDPKLPPFPNGIPLQDPDISPLSPDREPKRETVPQSLPATLSE